MPDPEGKLVTPVGFDADGYPRAGNLPFTFKGQVHANYSASGIAAGVHTWNAPSVPAGEIWIVNGLAIQCGQSTIDNVVIRLTIGADVCRLLREIYDTPWVAERVTGWFVLTQGDNVTMHWTGAAGGEDVYGSYYGFSMEL